MSDFPRHPPRTARQRLLFGVNMVVAGSLVVSGTVMLWANWKLSTRQVVRIDAVANRGDGNLNLPVGDLNAKNWLLTGSDNDECIDPNSPFAGGFGNRSSYGERSDTIMVIRVDPRDNRAAILSFPRDMWVKQAGSSRSGRINSNFDKKDPNRLIRTIKENFGVSIDHYVNVDFCTFKEVVDAIGGVRVPFTYKARDRRTGFQVLRANTCFAFSGEHALAYVRSRHYRWYDPQKKQWRADGTSDWGRISRQQDFTRRMIKKAVQKAKTDPRVATNIMNTTLKNVITDDNVTPLLLLQLGQAMRNFDANTMGTYTYPGVGQLIGKDSVIVPDFEGDTARKILAVFQGKASLAGKVSGASAADPGVVDLVTTTLVTSTLVASTLVASTIVTTTLAPAPDGGVSSAGFIDSPAPRAATTTSPARPMTTTTLPSVTLENTSRGIVPPNDPNCEF